MTTIQPLAHDLYATTIDGEQACILGCTSRGQHGAACPCHDQCPEHEGHCTGCAPRPTRGGSLLCGACFHRKLRGPLRRIPALNDWLTSRKAGMRAAVYDRDLVSSSKEAPLPFNPEIVDHLGILDTIMDSWADAIAGKVDPGPRPPRGAPAAAVWIEERAGWVAEQDWVPQLAAHLKELETRARRLCPWQPTRHALPVPCFRCEQQTLVLFGGEDWVTCTAADCDAVFGWSRYAALSRALGRIYGGLPGRDDDIEGLA